MTAYIGYDNKIIGATVTVTSEASGFEKENAYDWLTNDFWKASAAGTVYFTVDMGSATSIDSWGVAAHTLSDNSGTIKPQYSATGAWAGEEVDFDTTKTPTTNDPIFHQKTSVSARYWRFVIGSTGAASSIGALFLGPALALPLDLGVAVTRPRMSRKNKVYNAESNSGAYIGRSIVRMGFEFTISQEYVTHSWMDANWDSLADHIELYPFFFTGDYENYPNAAIYCWLADEEVPVPGNPTALYQSFSFRVNGI